VASSGTSASDGARRPKGKSRHEKDDRHRIDDRRRWVLGFDVTSILDRIQSLAEELARLRSGDSELRALGAHIEDARRSLEQTEDDLRGLRVERAKIQDQLNEHQRELADLDRRIGNASLCETQLAGLQARFERDERPLGLRNLDSRRIEVERALNLERRSLDGEKNRSLRAFEKGFADFKREWPIQAGDLDETLASAPEYLNLLQRIEHDGLPGFEEPFIGGACFVDIAERNRSATLQIAYDLQHHRLDLPDRDRLLPARPHARQASA